MKYLVFVLSIVISVVPVIARDIVLSSDQPEDSSTVPTLERFNAVYGGKGETELSWDDGVHCGVYFSGAMSPYATTFTAPAACHLQTYRFYWYGGSSMDVDSLLFADDGGGTPHVPTGSTLFTVTFNSGSVSDDWIEVDVSGEGITFANGEIFHPGWSFAAGTGKGVRCDNAVSGSYSCWTTSGGWLDYSGSYTFMVRAVVNDDMDGPYADEQDPADGETNVPYDADIVFHVKDDDVGVDISSINTDSVLVDKEIPVDGRFEVTGTISIDDSDPNDVIVTFDPDSDFEDGAWVTVIVSPTDHEIIDELGNEMAEDSWEFFVEWSAIKSSSLGEIKANFK